MPSSQPSACETRLSSLVDRHRVIIPVFIPEVEGYFAGSLKILSLCLESLKQTAQGRVSVTLIANGCCHAARRIMEKYFEQGWIDQLLLQSQNVGKVEAIVSAARGTHESLVTFADNDVLFRRGWVEAIENLFQVFPECGFASPVPLPSLAWVHTSSTVVAGYLRGELGFASVVDPRELDRFTASIDNPHMFKPIHRKQQLVLQRGNAMACVGCGHFVCTLRREVLGSVPRERCRVACGGWAVSEWIDTPPDEQGYWRLSTTEALACHLGNVPEPWMDELLAEDSRAGSQLTENESSRTIPAPRRHWTTRLPVAQRRLLTSLVRRLPVFRDYR